MLPPPVIRPGSPHVPLSVKTHPVAELQVSSVHVLLSLHVIAAWPHPPAAVQVSVVHALESSQLIAVCAQPSAAVQVSVVHALESSQLIAVCTQPLVAVQVSVVHALVSSQLIAVCTQPLVGSQVSVVHALVSSQFRGVPAKHWPWRGSPLTGSVNTVAGLQPSTPLQTFVSRGQQVTDSEKGVCPETVGGESDALMWAVPPE